MKLLLVMVLIVFSSSTLMADSLITLDLSQGKNLVTITDSFPPFHVSSFITLHPKIESVTLLESNDVVAYLNIFGGIGNDFYLEQGKTYEIYSSEPQKVYLNNY